MNVLITAPSLNEYENVSGVSSVARSIVTHSYATARYFHFRVGTKDGEAKRLGWVVTQLTLLPRLLGYIKKHGIDLIHLNTDFTKASLLRDYTVVSAIKLATGLPVLLHIHGGKLLMQPPQAGSMFHFFIRKILMQADGAIVLSEIERERLANDYGVESHILPNAVAPLASDPLPPDFTGKLNFIFLGRIVASKGIYQIVETFRNMESYRENLSFMLYGAGPDLPDLLERLGDIEGLEFRYGGVVKGEEKWAVLAEAHVFLLPSLYGEGLPVAMLEAMQSGCVPVVSDDASITTVVQNKQNGFVVKKGDAASLTNVLARIMAERSSLPSMSEAAKKTVAENYGLANYMKNLGVIYDSVMVTS